MTAFDGRALLILLVLAAFLAWPLIVDRWNSAGDRVDELTATPLDVLGKDES